MIIDQTCVTSLHVDLSVCYRVFNGLILCEHAVEYESLIYATLVSFSSLPSSRVFDHVWYAKQRGKACMGDLVR